MCGPPSWLARTEGGHSAVGVGPVDHCQTQTAYLLMWVSMSANDKSGGRDVGSLIRPCFSIGRA